MNDKFLIKGLAGQKKLEGTITVGGAKNAVLKIMAGSILFKNMLTIQNMPFVEDVKRLGELLTDLGASVEFSPGEVKINTEKIHTQNLDEKTATAMRSSVVLTGPLLARYGKVVFPAPGGCTIGKRPIDLFIKAYEKMGATVEYKDDAYIMTAQKLKGAEIFFDIQTVTGTETIMMAAVLAEGTTVLKNCAMEPEIGSLATYLVSCGADIQGAGTSTITIQGGGLLESKQPYITIPDRIETGSFVILGALLAKKLRIEKCDPSLLESLLSLLTASGVHMNIGKDYIEILESNNLKSFNVRTHEYPGIPTDVQPQLVTYLTQCIGEGIVFETIFEGRFKFIDNLKKMGAHIEILNNREISIKGPTPLIASALEAYDLRGGFSAVVSGLLAQGETVVKTVYYIDRGYESLETRLCAVGADIQRIQ
jgi:UDP-N-acetylglucosamine 1-carboxyvinyltransferase